MHFKKKVFSFLSIVAILFKAPVAFAISTMSVLEALHFDWSKMRRTLSTTSGQVSVFFPIYHDKHSLLWGSGRYLGHEIANASGVLNFEKLNRGAGYRYLYHPTQFIGFYSYHETLWGKEFATAGSMQPRDERKYTRFNPGVEWVSDWAKFNLDGYWLLNQQDRPVFGLITDQYGASLKLSSTFFRRINPFFIAYYGQIERYNKLYKGADRQAVKGVGIGVHWVVHPWVSIEIAPVTFDTLNRYSCYGTLSFKLNGLNVNTMSVHQKLRQPVNRYQPIYAV